MNDHDRASELLPWLVNGRLQGDDLSWLNIHLEQCDQCRQDLAVEQRVRAAVASQPTVEFAPQPSFNRLWQRIESDAATIVPQAAVRSRPLQRWRWVAAGVGVQLLVAGLLGAALWQLRAPDYQTVTSSAPSLAGETYQVVFDESVTLADIKEILDRSAMAAVAGPTPAGVFTLRASQSEQSRDATEVLRALRSDPRVRFAERTAR